MKACLICSYLLNTRKGKRHETKALKTGSLRIHLDMGEQGANMVAHVTYVYGAGGNDSSKGWKITQTG